MPIGSIFLVIFVVVSVLFILACVDFIEHSFNNYGGVRCVPIIKQEESNLIISSILEEVRRDNRLKEDCIEEKKGKKKKGKKKKER